VKRPPVKFDQVLGDREPDAETKHFSSHGGILLSKPFEHVRKKCSLNTVTRVLDDDVNLVTDLSDAGPYTAPTRGEFNRVVQHIPQYLLDPLRVRENLERLRRFRADTLDFLGACGRF